MHVAYSFLFYSILPPYFPVKHHHVFSWNRLLIPIWIFKILQALILGAAPVGSSVSLQHLGGRWKPDDDWHETPDVVVKTEVFDSERMIYQDVSVTVNLFGVGYWCNSAHVIRCFSSILWQHMNQKYHGYIIRCLGSLYFLIYGDHGHPDAGMPINQEPKILSKFDVSTSSVPLVGHQCNSGAKLCLLAYPIWL